MAKAKRVSKRKPAGPKVRIVITSMADLEIFVRAIVRAMCGPAADVDPARLTAVANSVDADAERLKAARVAATPTETP